MSTQQEKTQSIHRHMTIEQILGQFPQKAQLLAQEMTSYGLHCVGCHASTWETLEAGMLGHGLSIEKIDELEGKLNAILAKEEDLSNITLTPRAASKFMEILDEEKKQGWGLKFGEKMAGCSGFEYDLDFQQEAKENEETFVSEGINIFVKKALVPKLLGSVIDYVDSLRGSGFKVSNPNVRSSCGCGSSYNY